MRARLLSSIPAFAFFAFALSAPSAAGAAPPPDLLRTAGSLDGDFGRELRIQRLEAEGRWREAAALAEDLKRDRTDDADAWLRAARLRAAAGRLEEAVAEALRGAEKFPTDVALFERAVYWQALLGRREEARAALEELARRAAGRGDGAELVRAARLTLGWGSLLAGDANEALNEFMGVEAAAYGPDVVPGRDAAKAAVDARRDVSITVAGGPFLFPGLSASTFTNGGLFSAAVSWFIDNRVRLGLSFTGTGYESGSSSNGNLVTTNFTAPPPPRVTTNQGVLTTRSTNRQTEWVLRAEFPRLQPWYRAASVGVRSLTSDMTWNNAVFAVFGASVWASPDLVTTAGLSATFADAFTLAQGTLSFEKTFGAFTPGLGASLIQTLASSASAPAFDATQCACGAWLTVAPPGSAVGAQLRVDAGGRRYWLSTDGGEYLNGTENADFTVKATAWWNLGDAVTLFAVGKIVRTASPFGLVVGGVTVKF